MRYVIMATTEASEIKRDAILQLDSSDKEGVEELFREGSRLRIMAIGETGVGKSTLLNGLVGQTIFKTDRKTKQAVTEHVIEYKHSTEDGMQIIVFDCPGLLDGSGNEDKYIQEMNEKIEVYDGIDLILYCRRMDTTRANINDMHIITKLKNGLTLGRDMWHHTLFVLTFGNIYEKQLCRCRPRDVSKEFKKRELEWKDIFQEAMTKCNIDCNVKVCAAGDESSQQLCDEEYWLSNLWASAIEVLDECGQLSLLRLNSSRIVQESDVAPEAEVFKTTLEKQPIVLTERVKKVLGITSTGSVFATGGAAIGAAIGAVCIGVVSFGPATKSGLVIGGFIGVAVGSALGGAIGHLYERRKARKLAEDQKDAVIVQKQLS